jgi:light-regulated signal transduction histidine kinase (bacteriophytochrome)
MIFRCEDEPVHIPGAIQRYGALIAIREESGLFVVRAVSKKSQSVTGLDANTLFELHCFTDLLTERYGNEFVICANTLPADGLKSSGSTPDVFAVSLTSPHGIPIPLYCTMHLGPYSGPTICEFELDNAITSLPSNVYPEQPFHIIGNEATEPERHLSTTCKSKALHTLQVARSSSRQLALMDLFQIQSEIQTQLSKATDLKVLLDIMVGLVYDLTGFHRVMVYRFDEIAAGIYYFLLMNCK